MLSLMWLVAFALLVTFCTCFDVPKHTRHMENTEAKPYCPWGGYNWEEYPWAVPREDLGDWYCTFIQDWADKLRWARENKTGYEYVLYGDSLTQCLRNWGSNCDGATWWYSSNWGSDYSAINLALGGENPNTLMWRILNAHSPEGIGAKLIFLMVGSNALFHGVDYDAVKDGIAEHIIANAEFLAEAAPEAKVIVMGLLPKTTYDNQGRATKQQSDQIRDTNAYINGIVKDHADKTDYLKYMYCGDAFLEADGKSINTTLMSDGLHPNGKGWGVIGDCLQPVFDKYLPKEKKVTSQSDR